MPSKLPNKADPTSSLMWFVENVVPIRFVVIWKVQRGRLRGKKEACLWQFTGYFGSYFLERFG